MSGANDFRKIIRDEVSNNNNIIIKGYTGLELILESQDIKSVRGTLDIDMDYVNTLITQSELDTYVNNLIKNLNSRYKCNLSVKKIRNFEPDKSTGYKIMDSDTLITKLDINVGHCSTVQNICINSKEYKVNSVYGVIADKLSAIYSRKLFRRIKDLYDVYVLISNFDFDLSHIYNTLELKHRFLEDNRYIYGIEQVTGNDDNLYDLKHAWCATVDKISYIPVTFDDCYNKVLQFIFPITSGVRENLYWNHLTAVWIYTVCSGSIDEETNLFN